MQVVGSCGRAALIIRRCTAAEAGGQVAVAARKHPPSPSSPLSNCQFSRGCGL